MKTVAFFNNKGGVGKTTLTCNVAAYFALKLGSRVLVVDCDPQCNATQLILKEEEVDSLYWSSTASGDKSILRVLHPVEVGDAGIDTQAIKPFDHKNNRFGVDVIPGHPRLSVVEDQLSFRWGSAQYGDIGGLRVTNWCAHLLDYLDSHYDVAFIDLGPSLGSLNRTVLLGADFFVTPMGADVFSIVGIRNISFWLKQWIDTYEVGVGHATRKEADQLTTYNIRQTVRIRAGFVGYTVQQYIAKSIRGIRRPTAAFEKIVKEIPEEIQKNLTSFLPTGQEIANANLGDVPNMFSLIPLAQTSNAPIIELSSADGLVGAQFKQSVDYGKIIGSVANALARNIGVQK